MPDKIDVARCSRRDWLTAKHQMLNEVAGAGISRRSALETARAEAAAENAAALADAVAARAERDALAARVADLTAALAATEVPK